VISFIARSPFLPVGLLLAVSLPRHARLTLESRVIGTGHYLNVRSGGFTETVGLDQVKGGNTMVNQT